MITSLRVACVAALLVMLGLTVTASLERGIAAAATDLWADAWFRVTLADTYFAFLTVYLWMAYREETFAARALWLGLVVTLGTFAIATYLLIQLSRLSPGDPVERLFVRAPR